MIIDTAEAIHIQASDDVMVAIVQVMILDEQGKVVVEAWDLPGNRVKVELESGS